MIGGDFKKFFSHLVMYIIVESEIKFKEMTLIKVITRTTEKGNGSKSSPTAQVVLKEGGRTGK